MKLKMSRVVTGSQYEISNWSKDSELVNVFGVTRNFQSLKIYPFNRTICDHEAGHEPKAADW